MRGRYSQARKMRRCCILRMRSTCRGCGSIMSPPTASPVAAMPARWGIGSGIRGARGVRWWQGREALEQSASPRAGGPERDEEVPIAFQPGAFRSGALARARGLRRRRRAYRCAARSGRRRPTVAAVERAARRVELLAQSHRAAGPDRGEGGPAGRRSGHGSMSGSSTRSGCGGRSKRTRATRGSLRNEVSRRTGIVRPERDVASPGGRTK